MGVDSELEVGDTVMVRSLGNKLGEVLQVPYLADERVLVKMHSPPYYDGARSVVATRKECTPVRTRPRAEMEFEVVLRSKQLRGVELPVGAVTFTVLLDEEGRPDRESLTRWVQGVVDTLRSGPR